MNTNDTLLIRIIERDLQTKGIADYRLKDEVATSPSQIKVGANEMIYTYHILIKSAWSFKTTLQSSTQKVTYEARNMLSAYGAYQSVLISSHLSTVSIEQSTTKPSSFFIRYVRVIFNRK